MKRIFFFLAILLILLYLGICWYFSNIILNPPQGDPLERTEKMLAIKGPNAQPINDWLSVPDTFSVKSVDDVSLRGWHFQADSAQCAIIMAHGWSTSRLAMIKYMYLFEDCGCDIVIYDHRGHNKSDDAYATGGIMEAKDLLRITEWTQQRTGFSNQQIGWLGVSWGGATVLQAGAEEENVAFIISDSPFQDWHSAVLERAIRDYGAWINIFVPTIKALVSLRASVHFSGASSLLRAPDIDEPVFLIHSKADSATASWQSVNIAEKLNPDLSIFHHTEWGNDHAADISNNPAEFKVLVDQFIDTFVEPFGRCR
ncbi:MAG TPA: alpha/beta fold hydrolase [Saprospiraceae bacterium]|nr:alpha/beta fold hydrolase [Saprospiraceae bacterium]